jgi:hypothetical protein
MLKDEKLVDAFPGSSPHTRMAALQQVRHEYDTLIQGDVFLREKRFRNEAALAHVLVADDRSPKVDYDDLYHLHDVTEKLVIGLYEVCNRAPDFFSHDQKWRKHARVFWDTYFLGMNIPH